MSNDKELLGIQKEIAMFLSILVKRDTLQSTLIKELNASGFTPKRIAEIIGTTANTIRVSLSQMRKSKAKKS